MPIAYISHTVTTTAISSSSDETLTTIQGDLEPIRPWRSSRKVIYNPHYDSSPGVDIGWTPRDYANQNRQTIMPRLKYHSYFKVPGPTGSSPGGGGITRWDPIGTRTIQFIAGFGYIYRLNRKAYRIFLNRAIYESDVSDGSTFLDGYRLLLRYDATISGLVAPHSRHTVLGCYLYNDSQYGLFARNAVDRGPIAVTWAHPQPHALPRWHTEQMITGGFRDRARYATVGSPTNPVQILPDRNWSVANFGSHFIGAFGRRISADGCALVWGLPPATAVSAYIPWSNVLTGGATPGWYPQIEYFDISGASIAIHNGTTQLQDYLGTFGGLDFYGIAASVNLASFSTPPAGAFRYFLRLKSTGTLYTDTVNNSAMLVHGDYDRWDSQSLLGYHFPMINCEDPNDWIPGVIIDA